MKESSEYILQMLLDGAKLEDACRFLGCGEDYRIDRVMFRGSDSLDLVPTWWMVDDSFVDDEDQPLSDHEAVGVEFEWSVK